MHYSFFGFFRRTGKIQHEKRAARMGDPQYWSVGKFHAELATKGRERMAKVGSKAKPEISIPV
jgi:hypothetical protein